MPGAFARCWPRLALLAAVAVIAGLTLGPGGATASAPRTVYWCLRCTRDAGPETVANVLLFVPFGAALVLNGLSIGQAALVSALCAAGIEAAQYLGLVPGRVAAPVDAAANLVGGTVGGLAAASRRRWIRPTRGDAIRFAVGGWIGAAALLLVADVVLRPEHGRAGPPPRASLLPFTPGFGWFTGEVPVAIIGGTTLEQQGSGAMRVTLPPARVLDATALVRGTDDRRHVVPVLFVHASGQRRPHLMLAQRGDDALLRVRVRGEQWGFPAPDVVVRGAFRSTPDTPPARRLIASLRDRRWTLAVEQVGATVAPRGPTVVTAGAWMGWALAWPGGVVDERTAPVFGLLWCLALCLPAAWWSWCAVSRRR